MANPEGARALQTTEQTNGELRFKTGTSELPTPATAKDSEVRELVDAMLKKADAGVFAVMHKICDESTKPH